MRNVPVKLVLVAAALGMAACAKKKADLPPPPPPATAAPATEAPAPVQSGTVSSAAIPGSAADFAAQSGSDRVFFAYDSYELDDAARDVLGKQASWLQRYGSVRLTVEGHADERGTREYNIALGDRRANAVKNYLAAQGVDAGRIAVISYGKERPAVQGSDDESYAQNRRGVSVITGGAVGG